MSLLKLSTQDTLTSPWTGKGYNVIIYCLQIFPGELVPSIDAYSHQLMLNSLLLRRLRAICNIHSICAFFM